MHPILIAGIALVGLPILLHLIMKQEPKRFLFPAIRFLKIQQQTNQRKLRLRHWLLLALRALLIAIFCLALYQPRVPTAGLVIPLSGDQPLAVVLILDTTPSMGYAPPNGPTRLAEARRRALELLEELPPNSRIAVLDSADPLGSWEVSLGDARRKIESFTEPHGGGPPVTTALLTAYQLLKTIDQEAEAAEPYPRLVVVFSDRAAESWQADRAADLKSLREQIPPPEVAQLFVDVGVEAPANVAILAAEVRPASGPAQQPVTIRVTVQATGPDVPSAALRCRVGANVVERREIAPLPAGTPKIVDFVFRNGFEAGLHQGEVSLEATDALPFDNTRSFTFRSGETRKLLTLVDEPDSAAFWQLAHRSKGEFGVDVKRPDEVADFAGYDAVCLLALANPGVGTKDGSPLSGKLRSYVDRGGKVLVIPGDTAGAAYESDDLKHLLPGRLTEPRLAGDGATWAVPDPPTHEFLLPFREWRLRGTTDFLVPGGERKVWKFWRVTEAPPEAVIVAYTDDPDPTKRSPAVLEKVFPAGGKVVLLTVRMDVVWPADKPTPEVPDWHNYWQTGTSWHTVFPHMLARYLAGSTAETSDQGFTGQPITRRLSLEQNRKRGQLRLEGPGVTGTDATPEIGERQSELRLPATRTLTAGNFLLRLDGSDWRDGFSLNAPPEESNLTRVPDEAIAAIFGPDAIVPVGREGRLIDMLTTKYDPEIRLFPWLLLATLALFVVEALLANRFYRVRAS